MKNKIKVAIIGCGVRAVHLLKHLLKDSKENISITSVFDPNLKNVEHALRTWDKAAEHASICSNYKEAIDTNGIQWVMIFSPNAFHKEHILYSFVKEKHVFSEKPLATKIEDCQEIFEAHQKSNLIFATGFVLRYAPIYRRAKEILESNNLGYIMSIEANENIPPEHGGYIMANWRRQTSISGPHILEKCCHDLDLINWFCKSLPSKVFAMASKQFFIPENNKFIEKYGQDTFKAWPDPEAIETPFAQDSDLLDTFVSSTQYRNGIYVSFNYTMSNVIPERRMRFNCSEGTLIIELYSGTLSYSKLKSNEKIAIQMAGDGHGGGDDYIMKELYDTMINNTPPACSGNEGLESAVFALALDRSVQQGKMINCEDIWAKLKR